MSYIATATTDEERSMGLAGASAAQTLGMLSGPGEELNLYYLVISYLLYIYIYCSIGTDVCSSWQ